MSELQTRIIASERRAATIVARIAERYGLGLDVALCARWDRACLAARAEMAWALARPAPQGLGWAQRRIGDLLGCSQPNVRKLLSYHENNRRLVKRLMPPETAVVMAAMRRDDLLRRAVEAEEDVRFAKRELERLSGATLAERLAADLDIKMRLSIVLACLIEAYPNPVRGPALIEFYELACDHLGYGDRAGVSANLIQTNINHLSKALRALHGVENAIEIGMLPQSRRLADAAADWLAQRCGAPAVAVIRALRKPAGTAIGA